MSLLLNVVSLWMEGGGESNVDLPGASDISVGVYFTNFYLWSVYHHFVLTLNPPPAPASSSSVLFRYYSD